LEIERLIGEVARRHDLLLSRDDPVLITITLHELLLERAFDRLHEALVEAEGRAAAIAAAQTEAAGEIASRLITAAAGYADQEIRAAAKNASAEIAAALRESFHQARKTEAVTSEAARNAWRAGLLGVMAAGVAGLIALLQTMAAIPAGFALR
jgi:ABC-type multidrug transport system fused ATPase/permease subunit